MKLGTHIIKFPSGKWGFVGTLPIALGKTVPATLSDIMGGRAWRDDTGACVAPKFPVFDSESDARLHAVAVGVEVAQ